jgi:glycosyltransferase involved in cell wall biosynthesis
MAEGATGRDDSAAAGVLLVIGMWEGSGGLQVILRALMEELGTTRPVTVVTWHTRLRRPTRETEGGMTVVRLPLLAPWTDDGLAGYVNMAAGVVMAVGTGIALHRRWAAVLGADLSPTGIAAVLAGRLLGRRAVATAWIPGPAGQAGRLRSSRLAPLLVRVLRTATAVVVQTEEVADELWELGVRRIRLVPTGVPLDSFRPVSAEKRTAARASLGHGGSHVALYCGRFDLAQKRLDLLLEAWRRAALPGWRLALAGEGWDRAEVERLARSADGSAVVLGWREDVTDLYAAADLFVLPTRREGMSRALMEGLAAGLPGLVSDTQGHRRMAPDGVVLVPNEVEEWVVALQELAADEPRRGELGARGRAWVERHAGLERLVADYERILFGSPSK